MLTPSALKVLEPAQWQAELQAVCGHFHTQAPTPTLLGNIELWHKGYADFALVQHNATRITRHERDIAQDGEAFYFLIIQLAGQADLEQGKSRACLRQAGDMALIDSTQPSQFSYPADTYTSQLSLHLPRHLLQERKPQRQFPTASLIPSTTDYGTLINTHVRLLLHTEAHSAAQFHLSNSLLEVVCAQFASINVTESVLADHKTLQYLVSLIHQHAMEETFDLKRLAALAGMSSRSIQRLFQAHGQSCHELIQKVRLCRFARKLELCQRIGNKVHIATLAYEHGFADISTLNRLFRKQYGMSPSAYCGALNAD